MVSKTYTFSLAVSLIGLFIPCRSLAQETGTCVQGNAQNYLETNNVRAKILNNGNLFWDETSETYQLPKGENNHPVFGGAIWNAGFVQDELRMSAARYRNFELWPGPLEDGGNAPTNCNAYDHIWRISLAEIQHYNATKQASQDLLTWPYQLGAPVLDGDGNPDNYNLEGGDRPALVGTQMLWWIMNDRGNTHQATQKKPLGIEVRMTAFAYNISPTHPLNTVTFYRYQIKNRNPYPLQRMLSTIFMDFDLADSRNLAGTDSTLALGYSYTPELLSPDAMISFKTPQAIGVLVFEGKTTPKPDESILHAGLAYVKSLDAPFGSGDAFYNMMDGRDRTGKPLRVGGELWSNEVNPITRFSYTGNPVTKGFWSPENIDGQDKRAIIADYRNLLTLKPFDLAPNETADVLFAIVWASAPTPLQAVEKLQSSATGLRRIYQNLYDPEDIKTLQLPKEAVVDAVLGLETAAPSRTAVLEYPYPNPAQQEVVFPVRLFIETTVSAKVYDRLGRQVKTLNLGSRSVGLHELRIPTQDLPNGVYHLKMQAGWFTEARPFVVQH